MRNFKKIIIIIFLKLYSSNAIALSFIDKNNIASAIKRASFNADIGIRIKNLKTDEIIYEQNFDRYFNFASSLKAITVFSLMKYFGLDYSFTSEILKKDQNYYLNINDPDFSTKDLKFLIGKLAKDKPFEIKGNFYIVDHRFTLPAQIESRMIEDSNYCYGALITKVHINKNCIRLTAKASNQLKQPILLNSKELIPYRIVNKGYTILAKDSPKIKMQIEDNKIIVSGTLNKSDQEIIIGAVVNNSHAHLKNMLKATLLQSNITLKGQISLSDSPINASLIASINKSFNQIGSQALKKSDNFITDYILAEFGSRYGAQEWRECGKLLKQLALQKLNVDLTKATIVDGSGLSRYNVLTVNQFDDFLSALYHLPDFDKFLPMFATPNEDGTLEKRFSNMNIFAKTGTMTGISSLVGYVFDKDNIAYSFVIVLNNYYGSQRGKNDFYDIILKCIIQGK